MKDIKSFHDFAIDEYWPFMPFVDVKATILAQAIPESASQTQGEKVVQTWQQVAILETSPDIEVYFGFKVGGHAQFLNIPIETKDNMFGVRVGDGDVSFFVIPTDLKSRPTLRLVEITPIDNLMYAGLPLY